MLWLAAHPLILVQQPFLQEAYKVKPKSRNTQLFAVELHSISMLLTHLAGTLKCSKIHSPEIFYKENREAGNPDGRKRDHIPLCGGCHHPRYGQHAAHGPGTQTQNWFRRHTKLCVAVVILAVVAAVVGSQLRKSKAAAGASADYQYVRTTTLKTTSLNDSVTVNGTVKSGDEASVTVADSAKTYKVATVNVEVGDTVQEGDVIATLDTTDLEKQIENAEQSYNDTLQQAQTSYDRAVDEYNTAVVQHENNLIDLQAKIDDADKNLSDAQDALETAKSSRDSAQSAYDSACSSYDTIKAAYDNAAASISTFTDAVNAAANTQNDAISRVNSAIAAYNADPSEANQAAMNEANDALSAAQAAYQQAQNDLANAQNSCSVTELGLYGFTAI